jgi:uncharacterized protein YbaR (Trm112 family)
MLLSEPVCPACRGTLDPGESSLACTDCGRRFVMVAGIPDLRLIPDADDLARAKSLAARFDHLDFAGLMREGGLLQEGSISQNAVLRERFIAYNLAQSRTAAAYLDAWSVNGASRWARRTGCSRSGAEPARWLRRPQRAAAASSP